MSTYKSSGQYIGRFAPSPTGPLHLGSLICALASYLDAKAHQGLWYVRIEDLDPPREQAGADTEILAQLQRHGLAWDGDVRYQSASTENYERAYTQLAQKKKLYRCDCTRQQLNTFKGLYPGICSTLSVQKHLPHALRVRVDSTPLEFTDAIQGAQTENLSNTCGDFIVRRKDGLTAYQLAVVVDDALQGINTIVRGSDLLDSTPRQIYLQQLLAYSTPHYVHIPVLVNKEGHKLSKQTNAQSIAQTPASNNIRQALNYLQQSTPPKHLKSAQELIPYASAHFSRIDIPHHFSTPFA